MAPPRVREAEVCRSMPHCWRCVRGLGQDTVAQQVLKLYCQKYGAEDKLPTAVACLCVSEAVSVC